MKLYKLSPLFAVLALTACSGKTDIKTGFEVTVDEDSPQVTVKTYKAQIQAPGGRVKLTSPIITYFYDMAKHERCTDKSPTERMMYGKTCHPITNIDAIDKTVTTLYKTGIKNILPGTKTAYFIISDGKAQMVNPPEFR